MIVDGHIAVHLHAEGGLQRFQQQLGPAIGIGGVELVMPVVRDGHIGIAHKGDQLQRARARVQRGQQHGIAAPGDGAAGVINAQKQQVIHPTFAFDGRLIVVGQHGIVNVAVLGLVHFPQQAGDLIVGHFQLLLAQGGQAAEHQPQQQAKQAFVHGFFLV